MVKISGSFTFFQHCSAVRVNSSFPPMKGSPSKYSSLIKYGSSPVSDSVAYQRLLPSWKASLRSFRYNPPSNGKD